MMFKRHAWWMHVWMMFKSQAQMDMVGYSWIQMDMVGYSRIPYNSWQILNLWYLVFLDRGSITNPNKVIKKSYMHHLVTLYSRIERVLLYHLFLFLLLFFCFSFFIVNNMCCINDCETLEWSSRLGKPIVSTCPNGSLPDVWDFIRS